MAIHGLAFLAAVVLGMSAVACSSDADAPVVTPTSTVVASTATGLPPTPEPSSTPLATPIAEAATLDGCPVDDEALCQFALDAQDALNAGDITFFTSRLVAREWPCTDAIYADGDDVGCPATETGTSVPLVKLLFHSSDCCLVRPDLFGERLATWLADQPQIGDWRVFATQRGGTRWRETPGVTIVRGGAPNSPSITLEVQLDDQPLIPGVIIGSLDLLFVFPDSEFFFWQ